MNPENLPITLVSSFALVRERVRVVLSALKKLSSPPPTCSPTMLFMDAEFPLIAPLPAVKEISVFDVSDVTTPRNGSCS